MSKIDWNTEVNAKVKAFNYKDGKRLSIKERALALNPDLQVNRKGHKKFKKEGGAE
jgi:hypothetical protein